MYTEIKIDNPVKAELPKNFEFGIKDYCGKNQLGEELFIAVAKNIEKEYQEKIKLVKS